MKGLKKKILIALLAATCITAGAIGLSACGGEKNKLVSSVGVKYYKFSADSFNGLYSASVSSV